MTSSKMWAFLMLVIPVVSMTEDAAVHVRTNYKPYEDTWEAFKIQFGRFYSREEESLRYKAFVDRVQLFERHNQDFLDQKVSFSMEINQFTDQLDTEEWHGCHVEDDTKVMDWSSRSKRQTGFCKSFTRPRQFNAPSSWDWRNEGVVSPVGDQGQCGSCYAFGVATTITAQLKLVTKEMTLTPVSEQQLVDCFRRDCHGSNAEAAFSYISRAGGIMSAKDYPYRDETRKKGVAGRCVFSRSKVRAEVQGCLYLLNSETNLMYMVASKGPVYVSIAVGSSFHGYKSGIYDREDCVATATGRHCVTVVGYDVDYWIVKNSWGTSWGENGYGRIRRGKNICGIADRNTVPIVKPAEKDDGSAASVASWPFTITPWPFTITPWPFTIIPWPFTIIPLCLALSFAVG